MRRIAVESLQGKWSCVQAKIMSSEFNYLPDKKTIGKTILSCIIIGLYLMSALIRHKATDFYDG
jgi:hypothetical protein